MAPTKIIGIYAIRREDRMYVGHSVNVSKRWVRHRADLRRGTHHNIHLQRSWNKYGEDAFEFVILEECSVEQLLEREQHHMDQCSERYNIAPIAGSRLGLTHTPEAREKIRQANIGRKHSPETRAKMSAQRMGNTYSLGYKHSDETRRRMSEGQKARQTQENAERSV